MKYRWILAALLAVAQPALAANPAPVYQAWEPLGRTALSVTSDSANVALTSGLQAIICNTGAVDAFLKFGTDNTVAAVAASSFKLPTGACGNYELRSSLGLNYSFVAAITLASTTTLYIETGFGTMGALGAAAASGGGGGGTVSISQGTPGTTNGVQDTAAENSLASILTAVQGPIAAGAAIIGKVGIDQTTPGSTNGVVVNAGANIIGKFSEVDSGGTDATDTTNHALKITAGGAVADAVTASGNPVPAGAIYQSTQPTYVDGQRSTLHTGLRGSLRVELWGADSAVSAATSASGADGKSNATGGVNFYNYPSIFNGTTWDRQFSCPSFAAVAVTAGNTTQIIALSGATVIRICNAELSISATGSFDFLSGTGANCGTPSTDTGAIAIAAGSLQNISGGGPGMAVYRGAASGEFCVKATTGNVTGWVMYAQY